MERWTWDYEIRTVTKVGNSYVVVIPPRYLKRLNLEKGDRVEIRTPYDEEKGEYQGVLVIGKK